MKIAERLGLPYALHSKDLGEKAWLAIISRNQLIQNAFVSFNNGKRGHGFLASELSIDGRRILVISVHLDRISQVYNREKMPEIPLRIDYIFHSSEIDCVDAGVIKKSPGDHYPVWGKFEIRG